MHKTAEAGNAQLPEAICELDLGGGGFDGFAVLSSPIGACGLHPGTNLGRPKRQRQHLQNEIPYVLFFWLRLGIRRGGAT